MTSSHEELELKEQEQLQQFNLLFGSYSKTQT